MAGDYCNLSCLHHLPRYQGRSVVEGEVSEEALKGDRQMKDSQTKKHRDPFKGLTFNGEPVSKKEYIEAYESYVSRCSMITNESYEKN